MTSYWRMLLRPVARAMGWYLGLVLLRELLRLGGHYSMSATFRMLGLLKQDNSIGYWLAFLGGLALYFELCLRVNGATLWYVNSRINAPLRRDMRTGAFSTFLRLPPLWHQRHNSAVLVGEVNNGVDRVEEIVDATGWELAPLVGATLLSLVPLLWLSPVSAAVIAVSAAFFLTLNYRIWAATAQYRVARCDRQQDDWRLSAECVRRLPAVLMANAESRTLAEYERVQHELTFNALEEVRYEVFRHGRWRDRVMSWAQVALIGIWLQQLLSQTLSVVDCVYLWRICDDLFGYLDGYSGLFERFVNSTEPVKRFFALFAAETQKRVPAPAPEQGTPLPPEPIEVELRDVSFRYNQHSPCLESISVTVRPGEVLGVVGPSGSGKSTLAKLLCRLYEPDSGTILFNGRDIVRDESAAAARALISYVPQLNEAGVFERSVADNIRFARPGADLASVIEVSRAAGLHDQILELPQGYDTIVGESGCSLSGGQVQRLLLARELLKDAPVFVLDEATSGQDVLTESRILDSMAPRLAGKTIFVISHRLSSVRRLADRIAVLDNGRIVECGTERELLRARGCYYGMAVGRRRPTLSRRPKRLVTSGPPRS